MIRSEIAVMKTFNDSLRLQYVPAFEREQAENWSLMCSKLQNGAARIITFSSYDSNAEELCSELGWLKLSDQRKIAKSLLMYKTLNITPSYLS